MYKLLTVPVSSYQTKIMNTLYGNAIKCITMWYTILKMDFTPLCMRSSEPLRQQDGCSFGNLLSKSSSTSITRVQVPFNQRNSPSRNVANQTL